MDLQLIGDSVQSALAFLGNAATQFLAYRRTKILEEYNKDLVSFSEEVEPDLRAAAPLLFAQSFGKSFTKQVSRRDTRNSRFDSAGSGTQLDRTDSTTQLASRSIQRVHT